MRMLDRNKPQVWFGVSSGLLAGTILSFLFMLTRLTGAGAEGLLPGVGVWEQFGLFLSGGVLGGLLFGLAFPLSRWRAGRGVLGMVAVTPYFLGQWWLLGAPRDGGAAFGLVIAIVLVGGAIGYSSGPHGNPLVGDDTPQGTDNL